MGNKWIDFVKQYASKNNMSYGCALSDSKMRDLYRKQKDKPIAKKKKLVVVGDIDAQKREMELMGMEDVNVPDEKPIVIKKKKPKAKKPAEKPAEQKPKTSAAQYVLQNKYLQREIKSFIDFRFNKKMRDEVAEDIKNGIQFWLKTLEPYDFDEDIKYRNKRQEKAIKSYINEVIDVAGYLMRDLAIERLNFLINKNKLKPLKEDEYYNVNIDDMDMERVGLHYDYESSVYKTDGDSLDDVKSVLSKLKKNYMELMEKMDITPKDAIIILNKRIEKKHREDGKTGRDVWTIRLPKAKKSS